MMKRTVLNHKTRLLLTTGALFAFCASAPAAHALTDNEISQLMNRLNQMENQVQTLSRAVYRGDEGARASIGSGVAGADAAAVANNDQRMTAIEEQQQKITGQLEKINHDLLQVTSRLDRMQADTQQRLQALEHGGAAAQGTAQGAAVNEPAGAAPAEEPAAAPASGGTLGTISEGSAGTGPAEALYEEAFADVRNQKYEDGEAKFKQFLSQYPGHPLSSNAEYWMGETYYVRGKYKDAARAFAQGYQNHPKSGKAEDSLFKLALSLAKMGKKEDACVALRQMQKDFSGSTGPLHLKAQTEIKQLNCP